MQGNVTRGKAAAGPKPNAVAIRDCPVGRNAQRFQLGRWQQAEISRGAQLPLVGDKARGGEIGGEVFAFAAGASAAVVIAAQRQQGSRYCRRSAGPRTEHGAAVSKLRPINPGGNRQTGASAQPQGKIQRHFIITPHRPRGIPDNIGFIIEITRIFDMPRKKADAAQPPGKPQRCG